MDAKTWTESQEEQAEREAQARIAEQIRQENEAWRLEQKAKRDDALANLAPENRLAWELGWEPESF
jgi:hypothetical protein